MSRVGERRGQPHLLKKALEATRMARKVVLDAGVVQYEANFAQRIEALDAAIAILETR